MLEESLADELSVALDFVSVGLCGRRIVVDCPGFAAFECPVPRCKYRRCVCVCSTILVWFVSFLSTGVLAITTPNFEELARKECVILLAGSWPAVGQLLVTIGQLLDDHWSTVGQWLFDRGPAV